MVSLLCFGIGGVGVLGHDFLSSISHHYKDNTQGRNAKMVGGVFLTQDITMSLEESTILTSYQIWMLRI